MGKIGPYYLIVKTVGNTNVVETWTNEKKAKKRFEKLSAGGLLDEVCLYNAAMVCRAKEEEKPKQLEITEENRNDPGGDL